ncbi:Nucleoid-associated protein YejK [Edwardsiella tarda]|nr:Nucleoid-associated protein YejK [Edwardsiella tarda]
MSLDLENIALHQLVKRDEQQLEIVLRDSLLAPSTVVDETMAELHRVYNAKSKAYGTFTPDSELAQALTRYRKGEDTFLQFSRAATGRLRDELAKYPFADGGSCCFASIVIWRWTTCWSRCSTIATACVSMSSWISAPRTTWISCMPTSSRVSI